MSTRIHPSAVIAPGAELAEDVEVGPFAVIGAQVRIGRGSVVGPHATIEGRTTIGEENRIFQFAALGAAPQDLKFRGEDSALVIGNRNRIREFATIHPGTEDGCMETRIGDDNLLMAYTHVAHDCILGNRNILANGTQLGGHVIVESFAVLGALSGVHQFVRIGESAMIGAGSMVSQDVPPFCNATGDRAKLHGLNLIGLERRGFTAQQISAIKRAYRAVFRLGLKTAEAIRKIRADEPGIAEVERFAAFIESSKRGVCRGPRRSAASDEA